MRHLTASALSAATALVLAACGSATSQPGSSSQPEQSSSQPSSQQSSQPQSSADAVTGTVSWPDGNPALDAYVYFNNHQSGFSGSGWTPRQNGNWYEYQQLPADGSYSLPGCPCADVTAYLYVPGSPGAPHDNGGWPCWIIMQGGASETYSGLQISPGDVVDWKALNYPCSPTFYVSDPSVVQNLPSEIDPSLNGGDYSAYSGTWQAAESRTSGG
jgi:hypothetical protein